MRLTIAQAEALVAGALQRAGASAAMAHSSACALVLAEAQGLNSHGLGRVNQYLTHLANGRADGAAQAEVVRRKGGALLIDAGQGLAFPACELAVREAIAAAREHGVVFAGVMRSHHCGVVVDHLRPVAQAGMVGLGFANSPAAMPAAGGRHPIFGTNPVAAIFPRRAAGPLMIDLSLSEVARGKLMVAAKEGRAIPEGWALDAQGQPTTDPLAGMHGSMLPIGAVSSPKGAMLALVVELLVTAVIGAQFGFEASSFFIDEGNRPGIGQAFIVVDPGALAGRDRFLDRVEVLVAEMLRDDGVRLPGERREALRLRAQAEGLEVADALVAQWQGPLRAGPQAVA
ncbi:MAG: Ldh family oxidoreductase [Betaproteobacteria bacterium]